MPFSRTGNSQEFGIDAWNLRASEAENVPKDGSRVVLRLGPRGPVAPVPFVSDSEGYLISRYSDWPPIAAITPTLADRKNDGGLVLVGVDLNFKPSRVASLITVTDVAVNAA